MRKFTRMLQVLILVAITQNVFGQIATNGPGDWSNPTTWVGGVVPLTTDNVSIGHVINIDNASANCKDLVFTVGGAINFNTPSSVLSISGNSTFGDAITNIAGWTSGAKLVFTGTATQTWTTGASSRFDAIEVNKISGTLSQATGAVIRIGTNLTVTGGGTFTIGSGTDIEGVQFTDGTTATTPSITVGINSTFNIDAAAASFVRSGTTGTLAIGTITVNGTMNLGTTSGNGFQFGAVIVGDGTNPANLNITTNMGSSGLYNFSGLTVNNNGSFNMNATTIAASTITGDILGTGTVVYAVGSSTNHPAIDRSYGGNLTFGVTRTWTTAAPRAVGGVLTLNNASVLTGTFTAGALTINGDFIITGTSRLSWVNGNINVNGNLTVNSTNATVALYPQSAVSVLTGTASKTFTVSGSVVRTAANGTTPISTQYPGFGSLSVNSTSTIEYFKVQSGTNTLSIQDQYNGSTITYGRVLLSHAAGATSTMDVTINSPSIATSLSIAQASGTATGATFIQNLTFANTALLTIPSLTATTTTAVASAAQQNITLGAQPVTITGAVSLTDAASAVTSTTCILTINAGALTIGGALTVGTTGTTAPFNTPYILLNDPAASLTVTGATILRSLEQTNGTIKFTNNSQTVTFNGSCTTSNGNSGAEVFNFNGTNATINFNNNFSDGAAGATFYVTGTEVPVINFNNGTLGTPLTSSSAGLKGNVTVNGYRQITGSNFRTSNAATSAYSMTVNGTLDLQSNGSTATNSGGGTNTLKGTGTIKLTGDYATKITGYSTNNFQGTGTLHFNGATNQVLPAGTFNNVIADNTVSVTLGGAVIVNGNLNIAKGSLITGANNLTLGTSATATIGATGILSITGGTTDFAGKAVTIQSTASGTGSIGSITGNNTTTGLLNATNVTTQTYLAGGGPSTITGPNNSSRSYRFLAHPFTTSVALSQLQTAIDITGTGTGFDGSTSGSPSAFSWNQANANGLANDGGWSAYTSTAATTWSQYNGARVFYRGTKGTGLNGSSYPVGSATFSMTGAINTGNQAIPLTFPNTGTTSNYNFVGNPYPSNVQMSGVTNVNTTSSYYVWDITLGTRGAYGTKSYGAAYVLPAYASFFTETTGTGSLTFHETDKTASAATNTLLRTYTNNTLVLQIKTGSILWDELVLENNKQNTAALEYSDAKKLKNPDVSLYAISSDNMELAIDKRNITSSNIVPLGLASGVARNFTIEVTALSINDVDLYLHDKYLGTEQKIETGAIYNFSTNSDAASQGNNRFEILAKQIPVLQILPSTFTIKLSPNPATDLVKISFSNVEQANTTITLTNAEGKAVQTVNAGNVQTGNISMNVKGLAKGIYYVTLNNGAEKKTEKLVIQ